MKTSFEEQLCSAESWMCFLVYINPNGPLFVCRTDQHKNILIPEDYFEHTTSFPQNVVVLFYIV